MYFPSNIFSQIFPLPFNSPITDVHIFPPSNISSLKYFLPLFPPFISPLTDVHIFPFKYFPLKYFPSNISPLLFYFKIFFQEYAFENLVTIEHSTGHVQVRYMSFSKYGSIFFLCVLFLPPLSAFKTYEAYGV